MGLIRDNMKYHLDFNQNPVLSLLGSMKRIWEQKYQELKVEIERLQEQKEIQSVKRDYRR